MALSPMMQQYLRIHEQYPDCLLLFRLGDFYELFFDDAKTASRELELTLTGRDCGLEERAPMCGVPYHALNTYVQRLVEKGYKLAICEQLEDPALAKGLVDRDVIRVITAGTLTDPAMLEEKANNFLLCVYLSGGEIGLAYADVSTGEFYVSEPEEPALRPELSRLAAHEILTNDPDRLRRMAGMELPLSGSQPATWFQPKAAEETLREHFQLSSLTPLGLDEHRPALCAAGALMRYLRETQKNALEHLRTLRFDDTGKVMLLDPSTRRNLELTESIRGKGKKGTLLALLDRTATAMGGRLLRGWIEQPLLDRDQILRRHDAVEELTGQPVLRAALQEELTGVYDLERLLSKVAYRSLSARDCLALGASLRKVPNLRNLLSGARSREMLDIRDGLDPLEDLTDLLARAIHPEAPLTITEGGIIRDGYNALLDEYREAQTSGKQWILALEQQERESTGIKNLRVQYNRVFGYYIEVTKSYLSMVPDRYIRKQTLANAERYMTPELKEMERKIVGAQEQSVRLELQLFNEIRDQVSACMERIQRTCTAVKLLDVYQSLARVAVENRYIRPELTGDGSLRILEGRHPVVEATLPDGAFVPNDTMLDQAENRMMIITGPNMAGKSTYMRQVALICLMAQIGSFVPAKEAHLPICDRVFTRVGASDDLASGQSTFMVEMNETAYILRNATASSLIILDEIGRGTSTFDGLAIAWAVVEYIADREKIGAKTLFATHYHELSELEGHLEGIKNYCISVKEHGEDVIFLRKIVRGGADKSFGVHVARLAGIPHPVIVRAHEIQARLEVSDINQNKIGQNILGEDVGERKNEQVDLFDYQKTEIINELQRLDVMALTPMDAINTLFLLREKARKL
ncbi:MAG: DNA mismatch repair protein MutS [Clostridia bacterium]|nr:DNA mismatch repair protein MutS [Clostridia bacterium]